MKNIRKYIYEKYNNSSCKLSDILSDVLRDNMLDVEQLTELLKSDNKLLNIYKEECKNLNLTKNKVNRNGLDRLF